MRIYVDVNAVRNGNGTEQTPFRKINDAAKIAQPGDEVLVFRNYREYVDPIYAGREDARITYRSVKPLGAVITGAEEIKTWTPYQDNTWVCRVANSVFGSYNPYTTAVYGDWYFAKADKHTGCVYLNGRAMYEAVTWTSACVGKFIHAVGFRKNPYTNGMPNRIPKRMKQSFTPISREKIRMWKTWKSMFVVSASSRQKQG